MTFIVPVPTNHNDTLKKFDSLEEAIKTAYNAYGDVHVRIEICRDNQLIDIESQLINLLESLQVHREVNK